MNDGNTLERVLLRYMQAICFLAKYKGAIGKALLELFSSKIFNEDYLIKGKIFNHIPENCKDFFDVFGERMG